MRAKNKKIWKHYKKYEFRWLFFATLQMPPNPRLFVVGFFFSSEIETRKINLWVSLG